ncbi:uncharacterized protein LOC121247467 [Juglans microcarpa x Juglans regia]|uniref:uncharacterized protein LOC121247467 n=1 Tax=Juglans microcarpa x Juglans regia TaxID=2249226 RepID=UPI001B7E33AD|nr:uncharacterized protein LOC121247467 [Juglans microcarpa x Juglans regia]
MDLFLSTPALAISKPVPSNSEGIRTFLEKAADEGLVLLQSPKNSHYCAAETKSEKRAKCFAILKFEQLVGGELPIESDVSGEVIKILREDGDPVGYGDALIAILPSFPGIN